MLPKKYRLTDERDFKKLFKSGKKRDNDGLKIIWAHNDLGYTRFAFIVNNNISKSAARRNLIKRRLRAAVLKTMSGFAIGYDVAFLAKKPILEKDYQAMEDEINSIAVSAGLIKN